MKNPKIIIIILAIVTVLISTSACSATASEIIDEPAVEEAKPVETSEPAEETEEETIVEEPETVVEGQPEMVWSFPYEDNRLQSIAVSPDGQSMAAGLHNTTYIHRLADGEIIDVLLNRHSVEDLDYSADGLVLGAGVGLGGVSLLNIADGEEILQLHDGYNSRLAFSPDGQNVATGSREGIIWIWRADDGENLAEFTAPDTNAVWSIHYNPAGTHLAAFHWDDNGTVNIWDIEEEQIVAAVQLEIVLGSRNSAFRFSPDGEFMAGAVREEGADLVRLWSVPDAVMLDEFPVFGEMPDLAFSPDGKLLAVATFGRPTRADAQSATSIYDVSSRKLLFTLDQNFEDNDFPMAVTFTPDGGHLLVARSKGPLELWRLPGAEPLAMPEIDMKEPPPLPSDVLFDTGSAVLKSGADAVLEEFAADLYAALPTANITFIGHTDSRGDANSNMKLSLDRAQAVKDWFESWASDNDADGWEFDVDGHGDIELKVPDVDSEGIFLEEAGNLNRRVEIEIGSI